MLPIFQSFYPTAAKWFNSAWRDSFKVITDGRTGAPIGLVSQNANGPQGIWAPTPLTAAQIASPSAGMLADLNATFQLDESPYTRYRSDGVQFVALDDTGGTIIPPGQNIVMFSPVVITATNSPFVVEGGVRVVQ